MSFLKLKRLVAVMTVVALLGLGLGAASAYAYGRLTGRTRKGPWAGLPGPGSGLVTPGPGSADRGFGAEHGGGAENGADGAGSGDGSTRPLVGPAVPVIDHLADRLGRTGDSAGKEIALTFDAGWIYDSAPDLLRVLDEKAVKATFFLRARWVEDHPDLARDIAARGHLVEDHSYSHQDMTKLDPAAREAEFQHSAATFRRILGIEPDLFRPPYGAYDRELLSELGARGYRAAVMWTVDSLDWREPGPDQVAAKVLTSARDGAIVLMHVGSRDGVAALPSIIDTLRSTGYRFVRLDAMTGVVQ